MRAPHKAAGAPCRRCSKQSNRRFEANRRAPGGPAASAKSLYPASIRDGACLQFSLASWGGCDRLVRCCSFVVAPPGRCQLRASFSLGKFLNKEPPMLSAVGIPVALGLGEAEDGSVALQAGGIACITGRCARGQLRICTCEKRGFFSKRSVCSLPRIGGHGRFSGATIRLSGSVFLT
jgi:hypothetical protein